MPDGISCTGTLLLAMLLFFAVGVGMRNATGASKGQAAGTATAQVQDMNSEPESPVLVFQVVPTTSASPAATGMATETAAVSPTNNVIATETSVPTASVTAKPTNIPTATGLPADIPSATEELVLSPVAEATPLPLPTPQGIYSWTFRVPILMYHYISHPPENADQYRLDLSVTPENFRSQMLYLIENGYTTIDLYDLSLAIVDRTALPSKPIIITLDDGYRDNYENAFPVLRELGMEATFFVATEFVDQGNPNYMTWPMIKEMAAAGMRIEPHSKTHPDLSQLDRASIIWQVRGSQETIEAHIGTRPRYFAYPGGRYDGEVIQIMGELDFWGAVTTVGGFWHGYNDRYEWTRARVRNATTMAEFANIVE